MLDCMLKMLNWRSCYFKWSILSDIRQKCSGGSVVEVLLGASENVRKYYILSHFLHRTFYCADLDVWFGQLRVLPGVLSVLVRMVLWVAPHRGAEVSISSFKWSPRLCFLPLIDLMSGTEFGLTSEDWSPNKNLQRCEETVSQKDPSRFTSLKYFTEKKPNKKQRNPQRTTRRKNKRKQKKIQSKKLTANTPGSKHSGPEPSRTWS